MIDLSVLSSMHDAYIQEILMLPLCTYHINQELDIHSVGIHHTSMSADRVKSCQCMSFKEFVDINNHNDSQFGSIKYVLAAGLNEVSVFSYASGYNDNLLCLFC